MSTSPSPSLELGSALDALLAAALNPVLSVQPGVTADTNAGAPRPQLPFEAHPDSPVGRTSSALRLDQSARDPLRDVPLPDLETLSDAQLHALTARLLAEKHRRVDYWLTKDRSAGE